MALAVPITPTVAVSSPVVASALSWSVIWPEGLKTIRTTDGGTTSGLGSAVGLSGRIVQSIFASSQEGWALAVVESCSGPVRDLSGHRVPAGCDNGTHLFSTADGGSSWTLRGA